MIKIIFKRIFNSKLIKNRKFFFNTLLYRYFPGGWGYYRYLKKFKENNYNFVRDKHRVRHKHYGGNGWQNNSDPDGITRRDYQNYEEYVLHQKQKWDEILKLTGGLDNKTVSKYRQRFYSRFKILPRYLNKNVRILCLGARQGTEVEVLNDLGFKNVDAIDLNPGPNNPYVKIGDFMNIKTDNNYYDLIYTNCLDHVYDIDKFLIENKRVLKSTGMVYYDFAINNADDAKAFEAIFWASDENLLKKIINNFKTIIHLESGKKSKWILVQGKK